MELGEAELDYVMPWDEIVPANYKKWENRVARSRGKLSEESKKRVTNNEIFQLITENAIRLKEQQEKTFQTLNPPSCKTIYSPSPFSLSL